MPSSNSEPTNLVIYKMKKRDLTAIYTYVNYIIARGKTDILTDRICGILKILLLNYLLLFNIYVHKIIMIYWKILLSYNMSNLKFFKNYIKKLII